MVWRTNSLRWPPDSSMLCACATSGCIAAGSAPTALAACSSLACARSTFSAIPSAISRSSSAVPPPESIRADRASACLASAAARTNSRSSLVASRVASAVSSISSSVSLSSPIRVGRIAITAATGTAKRPTTLAKAKALLPAPAMCVAKSRICGTALPSMKSISVPSLKIIAMPRPAFCDSAVTFGSDIPNRVVASAALSCDPAAWLAPPARLAKAVAAALLVWDSTF